MKVLNTIFSGDLWLLNIIIIVLVAGALSLVEYLLSFRLYPTYERKGYYWHMALSKSLHRPAQFYIWLMAILLSIPKLVNGLGVEVNGLQHLSMIHKMATVLFIFWFVFRFIKNLEQTYVDRAIKQVGKIRDRTQVNAVAQILRVVTIVLFLLVLLPVLGIPTGALLTFGGATTVVIGFATKDMLSNFLGGLMIYWDRPFSVGDWVRSPDKEIEGTVEDIGWRLTRIRTFDKRPLYVPNGLFSNISIENPSRMTNRRIKTTIGIRYSDADRIPAMLTAVEDMLKNHPEIDTKQTLMVNVCDFADSSLNFFIYTFTKTTNWVKFEGIRQDVVLKVYEIIRAHGADCAFPTRTLHIPDHVAVDMPGDA